MTQQSLHSPSPLIIITVLFVLVSAEFPRASSMIVVDIVTGATQGIGKAVAEYIAIQRSKATDEQQQYALVLVGRSEVRGTQVRDFLRNQYGQHVHFTSCDLSDWREVQQLPARIAALLEVAPEAEHYRVGILVNAAAECPPRQQWVVRPQRQSEDGSSSIRDTKLDKQFASNVLGYHFMMRAFQDHYFTTAGNNDNESKTHIVNVASTWAGGLDLTDVQFQRRGYDNDDAYRQSKQCNRMLNKVWSNRLLDSKNVLVNACHPGDPCTTLSKALGYNMFAGAPTWKQIEKDTPFSLLCGFGSSSSKLQTTGGWFVGSGTKPSRCGFEHKSREAEQLFELCESFCV